MRRFVVQWSVEREVYKKSMPNTEKHDAFPAKVGEANGEADEDILQLPDRMPILPLRGIVVYPLTLVPIRVGQARSVRLIEEATSKKLLVGLATSHDPELETPGPDDIYRVGTIAAVHRLFKSPDGTITLMMQGLMRMRIEQFVAETPYLMARVSHHPETVERSLEVEALHRTILAKFNRLSELSPAVSEEMSKMILDVDNPLQLAYAIANHIKLDLEQAQAVLEIDSLVEKMRTVLELLNKELEVLELGHKIQSEAQSEMEKTQREYFLREQLKAIQLSLIHI